MVKETLDDLSAEAFDQLIEDYIGRGDDKMELSTFFGVMADLEKKRKGHVIELSGKLVNGEVLFDRPSPLPVDRNQIYIGDRKIVLRLRAVPC